MDAKNTKINDTLQDLKYLNSEHFIILCLAVPGLHCGVGFSLVAASRGYSRATVHRLQ